MWGAIGRAEANADPAGSAPAAEPVKRQVNLAGAIEAAAANGIYNTWRYPIGSPRFQELKQIWRLNKLVI